jgi:hypothetical protein
VNGGGWAGVDRSVHEKCDGEGIADGKEGSLVLADGGNRVKADSGPAAPRRFPKNAEFLGFFR